MNTAPLPASPFQRGQPFQAPDGTPHDPFHAEEALPDTAVCEACGAVHCEGRWQWAIPPAGAQAVVCPACRRMSAQQAAGHITIAGAFACEHRDEIINLVRHVETHEKAAHPLHRIMSCRAEDGALLVDTTDAHLARAIGEALERAYKGELWSRHMEPGEVLRLHWQR